MVATRRQRRARFRVGAAALAVVATTALAACSSTSGTETTSGPSTSTTAAAPGTTAAPSTSAAPGTTEATTSPAATAATLTAADLGAGWADYPEDAEVYGEEESGGCVEASGLLDDIPDEDISEGAIIQYGDRLVFAQTNVRVFPTPADAQAFAAHVLTDEFVECRRAELEDGLPDTDPPLAVASTGTSEGDGSTPYVGSFTYETQQVVDGVGQPAGGASRHAIYVKGPVVIDLFTQTGVSEDDPADLYETTNTMFDDAMDVVLARVDG